MEGVLVPSATTHHRLSAADASLISSVMHHCHPAPPTHCPLLSHPHSVSSSSPVPLPPLLRIPEPLPLPCPHPSPLLLPAPNTLRNLTSFVSCVSGRKNSPSAAAFIFIK
ncbi:hypothetical protein E2C01_054529 [Portunus trituberculatus]|uniref:Uncharacterized protein n=1 Tax=Portunus trituberculatus TaxID=210409 RepID=A0A5B7GVA1_PORTR|nr:hypothetical protein [Portunus trituberculatus]